MKKVLLMSMLGLSILANAQTNNDLLIGSKNPENVVNFGLGYDLKMFSSLKQINKKNVKQLVPVWSSSVSNEMGEHSQPTVFDGVMYVVNGNWTFAFDLETGRQIWRTPVQYERAALRVAGGGALMRGPATIYSGKLFRQSVDDHLMALDMKTGKEIWKTKFADWKDGTKGVIAPMIANGVLISGMGGSDTTARGFIEGYDPETGKQLWRTYTIPAPGEPGSETWPTKNRPDAWKYGGGSTWQYANYDPQLDLIYIGTGNAEPYNPEYRDGTDGLYTSSILALRPKTGEMVWFYQYVPNDSYDFDSTAESILADVKINGEDRKILINAHKNGFLYVLDRTNGKLLSAKPYVKVNWASEIDLKTGRPVLTDILSRAMSGETVDVYPSRGTNAVLNAYNPKKNLMYINAWNQARVMKYVKAEFNLGSDYTGVQSGYKTPAGEPLGFFKAVEPLSGKVVWSAPVTDMFNSAGVLATDGDLLFTGKLTGEFIALDQDSGKQLWQYKTGSGINAPPITYSYKGRQYVAILSGIGGSNPKRFAGDKVPTGGSVTVFALPLKN
ncbi:pyrroloquinoline quinone-dependent dehydrogenase [Polynucleobacter kasalickyi]|uniref:Alcohol dehydrogenase (Cytochrome c) n=1 Tax=Polynucleobacter kasalickyi TaxID=1938817 RepID=A0A1W1Z5N0_9BURK|nr:PQQ-dependent dehydrogenase, methanol/ethanol family [Polynucleobacter kasalickyi]SMC43676.1 alcohol dehydrogenase (cytochrome c) [Polynucleobacter kasalickyi]